MNTAPRPAVADGAGDRAQRLDFHVRDRPICPGKAFAAGLRSIVQAAVVIVPGVTLTGNPLKLRATDGVVVLGSAPAGP